VRKLLEIAVAVESKPAMHAGRTAEGYLPYLVQENAPEKYLVLGTTMKLLAGGVEAKKLKKIAGIH
jgi:hypothetical protein